MHLFNTEMIFLHPPRTRFAYGRNAPRLSRYGRRAPPRADATPADPPIRIETATAASPAPVVVERAA